MKRLKRPILTAKQTGYLRRRRNDARNKERSGSLNIEKHWKASRETKTLGEQIFGVLQQAGGARLRCMYCLDSHGSDIDHFYPKGVYKLSAYTWRNFVLNCTYCGRLKGNQFPMRGRRPLLINPFADDPWEHLTFDPATGNLTARFDVASLSHDPKGVETVRVLHLDRREGLSNGYKISFRRLSGAVARFLDAPTTSATLIAELESLDDYGLSTWIFHFGGSMHAPFDSLALSHSAVWADCAFHFRS